MENYEFKSGQFPFKFFLLILSISSFISFNNIKASDLITNEILVPGPTAACNQPFNPRFDICNINIYTAWANEWTVSVIIKDAGGNTVFSSTVPGVDLANGSPLFPTCVTLQTTNSFTPTASGTYTITVDVNYSQDINTNNDIKVTEFNVVCPPGTPINPSPADGATDVPVGPPLTLGWERNPSDGSPVNSSSIYVAPTPETGSPDWGAPLTVTSVVSGTVSLDHTLPPSMQHSWRVDQSNSAGTTEGTVWTFWTGVQPCPDGAVLLNPQDEATDVDYNNAILEWTNGNPGELTGLEVYLGPSPSDADPNVGLPISTTSVLTLTHYTPPQPLLPNTTYWWRVGQICEGGTNYGEQANSFTTAEQTDLGVLLITRPTTQEFENVSFQPAFTIRNYGTATANAGNWNVAVRTRDAGDNTVLIENVAGVDLAGGTEIAMTTTASFTPTTSLNVEVEVINAYDSDGSNNLRSVSMQVYGPPNVPSSPIPLDGAVDVPFLAPREFQFTVVEDPPAREYGFTFAVTPETGEPSWSDVVTGTINAPGPITYTHPTDLLPNTDYSWRIDLTNPAGTTPGAVWRFLTSSQPTDLGVEEISKPIPAEFENVPFNPTFKIRNYGSVQADATDWNVLVSISDNSSGTPNVIFQETVPGVDLAPGANVQLVTSAPHTPTNPGSNFEASALVNYSGDTNNSNDESILSFTVYQPPIPPTFPINPADGANDIPFDLQLTGTWENTGGIPIDNVRISWLATSSEVPDCGLAVPVSATIDAGIVSAPWPGELVPDQEYWWRITQSNPAGETCSEPFSFNTAPAWEGRQLLPGEGVDFFQVDFTFPNAVQMNSPYGLIALNFSLIQAATGFLNGFVNVTTDNGWVVNNMFFDGSSGYPGWSTFFDLNRTDDVSLLDAYVFVSPDPIISFDLSPIHSFDVDSRPYNAQGTGMPRGNIPAPMKFEDIPFVEGGESRVVWQHGHVSIEQDENQCAPASLANSLQWLENEKGITVPDEHKSGIRDNTLVGEIDKTMNRAAHSTISGEDMITGKVKYIDENDLSDDLIIKHKRRTGTNLISNDTVKVGNTKSIPNTDTTKSLIDWIIDELEHGEDVELVILWDGGGGHAVDLIGGGYVEGVPWLAWVHDANQGYDDNGTAGNVADDKVKKNGGISPDSGGIGWSYIINNKLASVVMGDTSKGTINFALSESKDTTTTGIDDYTDEINPSEFKLEQNYPNPFNPVTIINYNIPINTFVTIKIFDLNGREVKVLVSEYKDAGNYKVNFDAHSLASGVYFYRMEAGKYSITKKAILLR